MRLEGIPPAPLRAVLDFEEILEKSMIPSRVQDRRATAHYGHTQVEHLVRETMVLRPRTAPRRAESFHADLERSCSGKPEAEWSSHKEL